MINLPKNERLRNMFGCVEMEEAALHILREVIAEDDWNVSLSFEDFIGNELTGVFMLALHGWLEADYPNGNFVVTLEFKRRIIELLPIEEGRRHLLRTYIEDKLDE